MAHVRRIPLNADLKYLKQELSKLLTAKIAVEYPDSWWYNWLEWGIDRVVFGQSDFDYGGDIDLEQDLIDAEVDQNLIDWFKPRWFNWIANRLECCGLIELRPNDIKYEYKIVTRGYQNGVPNVEFWIAVEPDPGELDALISRSGVETQTV